MPPKKKTECEQKRVDVDGQGKPIEEQPTNKKRGAWANGKGDFPVVGIGAWAGGLSAYEAFFAGMPAHRDPDMAFVLVPYLVPDHKSMCGNLRPCWTFMAPS